MLEAVTKFGVGGGIGLLIGLALATWIGGLNEGGFAIVVAISMLVGAILGGIISALTKHSSKPDDDTKKED